ncbi:hypothetical protein [Rubritepida flocculans]|uniref:hypothetical protein n=1 Tax=Rubritepida flocculans TaxID=182403 RepID=UPI00040AF1C0|nr:hypothetical protein [Rubritepida flocculans]
MSMRAWKSPGPVSSAFVDSDAPVSVLMGPAAGGKTVTGLQRGVLMAMRWPETKPGLRQCRFLVMRQRMTDMEASTILSWLDWYPRSLGSFVGKEGSPKRHSLRLRSPLGGVVELEVHFRGIGEQSVDDALRGFEFSFAYVDECDLMDADTMANLFKRAGRFPSATVDINPCQVWGTCNAPEPDSWVVRDMIENPRPGWVLYRQPSGLSPEAENLEVLGRDFYRRRAAVLPDYERKRFVENIPGLLREEAAVYPEFAEALHVAPKALSPLPGLPLRVGVDAGGTPAAAVMQRGPDGQWRMLAELSTHDRARAGVVGPQRFGEALAALLAERAPGWPVEMVADPASAYGADREAGESAWVEIVARAAGLPVGTARTQDPTLRIEALRRPLARVLEGGRPGLLLDPSCRLMARALARDYRWQVTAGRRGERAVKNWASHLVEAAQYAVLDGEGLAEAALRPRLRAPMPARFAADWNPWSLEEAR